MQRIKVMTYNIHSGLGRDRLYRLDRVIEAIKNEDPDIVALQEVDNNLGRSNRENQSKIIGDELKMHYHHCVNHHIENGEYGITTLSRFPMINAERHDLSFRFRLQPRGSLRTDLALGEKVRLHVFNVHLGLRLRERQYQRRRLLSESILLDQQLQDPIIVLGDFNDRPISVVHQKLRIHFRDVCDSIGERVPATFRRGPIRFRLDHIYLSKHLRSIEAYVIDSPVVRVASDHLPVVAIIEPSPVPAQ
jgi:endonuclease/exonuclease/phosphatase family metal-dependent hydrolase